ncbi:MAG TPA: hypothetical protein VF824_22200 [Thermoanaerobaculia bacterium]
MIDSRAPAGEGSVRSRREALERLSAGEYDTIVLHTASAGRDEYDFVAYLAATWPTFLRCVKIRTITPGADSYEWNPQNARFEPLRAPSRRSRGLSAPSHASPPAAAFLR